MFGWNKRICHLELLVTLKKKINKENPNSVAINKAIRLADDLSHS